MGFRKLSRWVNNKLNGYDIPDIIKSKELVIKSGDKICVLAPHADDETIGCGGLLAKYASQCDVIVLTDGSKAGDIDVRKDECAMAMNCLGVSNFSFIDAKDGYLADAYEKFKKIDFSKYDYVFMPHIYDSHKDHVMVAPFFKRLKKEKKIKAKACYYEVWGTFVYPTHFVDISAVADRKKEAINLYKSQIETVDYASRILGLNHYRAMSKKVDYIEAFVIES